MAGQIQPQLSARAKCAGVPRLWRLLGGLAAVGLGIAAQGSLNQRHTFDALVLGVSGVVLWLHLFGRPRTPAHTWVDAAAPSWQRDRLGGAALLGAVGLAAWALYRLDVSAVSVRDWQWYALSVCMGVVGAVAMQPWRRHLVRHVHAPAWPLWCLLIGAAVVVRFWRLDSIPYGTWYDEAANGLEALRVLREPGYQPIYTDGVNATGHYLWLLAGSMRLFGENTLALRLISALMGVATVAAAYGAGREIYGDEVGLAAAGLMATAHWSVTFSRMGMYNSATPLAELVTLWLLARGMRRNSPLDYALAGLALGLGLCFYSAFQLFAAVLAFFLVWLAWRERPHWRRLGVGLGMMVLVALLVIAPVAKFAIAKPDLYFSRVQNTSLLRDESLSETLPALLVNTRKHLLMFNVAGDPNGRHNLPGAPLLDVVSGALLVLGVSMSVRRANRLEMALLPVWVAAGLLGGILSLGFEAPQSLRSIAAQPAIYLLVALPLGELAREWRTGAGRDFPAGARWLLLLFLLPIAYLNTQRYFERQSSDFATWNAYSTPETMTAEVLRSLNGAEAHLISLYDHHPTVRFLAPGVQYERLETNATLPLLQPAERDLVLILDTERSGLFAEARRLYPGAVFEERRAPFGGPVVLYVARISAAGQAGLQGLMGAYQPEGQGAARVVRMEQRLDFKWPDDAPVALPFSVEWEGVLAVNTYGTHQFVIQGPGEAALYIGEEPVLQGDASRANGLSGALLLARGHHNLRVRADGGEGRFVLAWRAPSGEASVIPPWTLYVPPVRSNGLMGRYYANETWSAPESFAQIDPQIGLYFHVPVLPRPYSVAWTGKLAVPVDGQYGFALESIDESVLMIDGQEIAASHSRAERATAKVGLVSGLHDIEVRYVDRTDHTYINLYWQTPDQAATGSYQIIPSDFLFPPQKDYTRMEMPALQVPVAWEGESSARLGETTVQPASVEVILDGLAAPRGIAVAGGRVYVAETGAARVVALDVASGAMQELKPGDAQFVEPMDLAGDGAGGLVVLDAGAGRIDRFDAAGEYVATLPASSELTNRARGIDVDGQGRVWVASTPAQRMVALDANGAVVGEIVRPAVSGTVQEMQPVDLLGLEDGSVFATDAGNHRLYWFSGTSAVLRSYALPVANSLDGSHLAGDSQGNVYVTEPETGRIVRIDAEGQVSATWSARTPEMPEVKPVGIAVEDAGQIWVTDVQGGRVLRLTAVEP